MNTFTTDLYLTPFRSSYSGDVMWMLSSSHYRHGEHGALCESMKRTVTVDLPPDFNPISAEIASLEAEKALALEQYQKSVARINDRLSKLQAITNEVQA